MEPRQIGEAGAAGLPDRPQGVWAHGPRRSDQDQERDRSDAHVSAVLPGGDLWVLRDEHRRL